MSLKEIVYEDTGTRKTGKLFWKGKPIGELTHEELLNAFCMLHALYEKAKTDHEHEREVMSEIRNART